MNVDFVMQAKDASIVTHPDDHSADSISRRTAIVVLTWNELDETRHCLRSLQAAGYALDRVVLWDNGSTDGTDESIAREFPDILYHRHATNLGVASGRNAAASLAIDALSAAYLMFLDNDTVVTAGFLEALSEAFAAQQDAAQAMAKVRLLHNPEMLQCAGGTVINFALGVKHTIGFGEYDTGQYDQRKPCLPSGGATLVKASVFVELGGFDTVFDPYGAEDLDFAYRVRSAGYTAWYVPESVVYHGHWSKLSEGDRSESATADMMSHWVIMLRRHASLAQKIAFFSGGAAVGLTRYVVRELSKGHFAVIKRVARALWIFVRDLLRRKARRKKPCYTD